MLLILLTTYSRVIAGALIVLLIGAMAHRWRWPLLLDVLLLGAYGYIASPRVLILALTLGAVRWVPAFAAIVASALNVPTWGGLSLPVALFALPGLSVYTSQPRGAEPPRAALPPVVAVTGRTTRLEAPTAHARMLEPAEWIQVCNDEPTAPHLGVVGATQLGKTTFVLALVGRRPGELVITTTKNDRWAGADVVRPAITLDGAKGLVDWTPIARAINRVHFEMLRRNIEQDSGAPITLVIDEFTTTLGNIAKETRDQIVEIWSMGAACGVRVIVIAQEVNARAWGLEGRRDVLNNLQFAKVEPGRLWCLGRLGPNGEILTPQPLDTHTLVALAAEAQLTGRGWAGVGPVAAPGGVGGGVPVCPVPPSPPAAQAHAQSKSKAEQRIALYMTWRHAGMKSEVARALRHAEGAGLDDVEWAEAGKRLANQANSGTP